MPATRQVLKQCSVFQALTETELDRVASLAVEKEYEAGATIFRERDTAAELLVIKEGKVALQMTIPAAQGIAPEKSLTS
jgi:CRP-like cAMP-binding protein